MTSRYGLYLTVMLGVAALLWLLGAGSVLLMAAVNDRVVTVPGWQSAASSANQVRQLLERLRDEQATLVFGTSRANQISGALLGEPAMNLHYVYGNPRVVSDFLARLDEEQWRNVTGIFFLVDIHTLEEKRFDVALDPLFRPFDPWNWLAGVLGNLGPHAMQGALERLAANLTGRAAHHVDAQGVAVPAEAGYWDGVVPGAPGSETPDFGAAPALGEIQAQARAHGIEPVFATPVLSAAFAARFAPHLEAFLESVMAEIDRLHLFLVVPQISDERRLFRDESHLNRAGLRAWFDLDWERYLVTDANWRERLGRIKRQLTDAPAS